MKFTDICLITSDVIALREFYEKIFSCKTEGDATHSFLNIAGLGLAIYDVRKAEEDMGFDFEDNGRGMMTIGFNVEDVDAEHRRISEIGVLDLSEPELWPWGAKSFNYKDIDGNRIVMRSWPSANKESDES